MKREYILAAAALIISLGVMGLAYNFLCWHYFRGYNEVSNMFVWPVVLLLVLLNLIAAGVSWAFLWWRNRKTYSSIPASFLLAAVITISSPLFAPSIGRLANRNLWITTPFTEAVRYGDAPVVIALLKNGADPNEREYASGATALHFMAYQGETEAVKLLLSKGADPNAKANMTLETPLHWAVTARANLATIRMLVDHGASTSAVDQNGKTPVDYTRIIPEPQATEMREAMR